MAAAIARLLLAAAPPLAVSSAQLPARLAALPADFEFGVATAAYQIEGGAFEGGRGPSIWDTFAHTPGRTFGGDTGDVADDHYHRFREDVALMKSLGVRRYRMSLSWPRLLPRGRGAALNEAGVAFYAALFEELRRAGIEALVTLYHWDLPQALEDDYGGWLGRRVVDDFADYADLCFAAFGDSVASWTTFNEALTFIGEGYGDGVHAPGRCSDRGRCASGDSEKEPLVAGHHVLLAHAAAAGRFRRRFGASKTIGMVNCGWMVWPLRGRAHAGDAAAAESFMEAQWAWFLDPVVYGDYPDSLKARAGADLPAFSAAERAQLRGSVDYLGVNYYTSRYVAAPDAAHTPTESAEGLPHMDGLYHVSTEDEHGLTIGPRAGSPWLYVAPRGIADALKWLSARYPGLPLRVTENGCAQPDALDATLDGALDDAFRVDYLRDHVDAVAGAASDGVPVEAYYAWSLLDNYEWADGYSKRFGLVHVNFTTLARTPKRSARWYADVLSAHAARSASDLVVVPAPDQPGPPPPDAGKLAKVALGALALAATVAALAWACRPARKPGALFRRRNVELPELSPLPYVEVF